MAAELGQHFAVLQTACGVDLLQFSTFFLNNSNEHPWFGSKPKTP